MRLLKESLGLVALPLGLASVSANPSGSQRGMTTTSELTFRNTDEVCASTVPVQKCQEDFVVQSTKTLEVGFHCTNINSVEGQRWKEQVENNQVIPGMSGRPVHVKGHVQVPTKCIEQSQVSSQEQRRRKIQQEHQNRVELNEDGEEFYPENQWESEEDQLSSEEQYSQYRKNRLQEENEWQRMSLLNQYPELMPKKLHQLINANELVHEETTQELAKLMKKIKVTSHLTAELEHTLPSFFKEVAKQVHYAMKERQQHQNNQHHSSMGQEQTERLDLLVGDNQEFKNLMQRVYTYVVKETLKLNQKSPRTLSDFYQLTRKMWGKVQSQELTRNQIQKVKDVQREVQELLESDQTKQSMAEELVTSQLKFSQKEARKNLMRIIITGMMMKNSPTFQQNY